jgi:hypothetical protein
LKQHHRGKIERKRGSLRILAMNLNTAASTGRSGTRGLPGGAEGIRPSDLRGAVNEIGNGELVRRHACQLGFEGIVSKTADVPYASGNRRLWR